MIERIAAVREAIGPNTALLVDCHSRLSPVMARDVLKAIGNAGPEPDRQVLEGYAKQSLCRAPTLTAMGGAGADA